MNIYVKFIFGIITILTSLAVIANPPEPQPVHLTLTDVCTLMAGDSKLFIDMYKAGKTHEDISTMLNDRFAEDPAMEYALPGLMRILNIIQIAKTTIPKSYATDDFVMSMVVATYDKCMQDKAIGWAQEIEGLASKPVPKIKI